MSAASTSTAAVHDKDKDDKEDKEEACRISSRAKGRWKLLRRAIVRSAAETAATASGAATVGTAGTTTTTTDDEYSIHRFGGYNMLPSPVVVTRASHAHLWEQLLLIQFKTVDQSSVYPHVFQAVQESILALTAMDPSCRSFEFSIRGVLSESESSTSSSSLDTDAKLLLQWSDELRGKCTWKTCNCQWLSIPASALLVQPATAVDVDIPTSTSAQAWQLRIRFEPEYANPQYVIRQYTYTSTSASTYTYTCTDDADNNSNISSNGHHDGSDDSRHHPGMDTTTIATAKTTVPTTRAPPVTSVVLARERLPHTTVSLQELVSHHHHNARGDDGNGDDESKNDTNGIDNTGNICVWDCEKTLAWVLLQQLQLLSVTAPVTAPCVLTELGAGMVGLAGLLLVAAASESASPSRSNNNTNKTNSIQELYLTDGHIDSVHNNRVHVRLGQAAAGQSLRSSEETSTSSILPSKSTFTDCRVNCSVLKWSIDKNKNYCNTATANAVATVDTVRPPPPADWTLVSDCTHFEEYHSQLFWTLVQSTCQNGSIWMCQPNRGKSLERFLDLVRAVNVNVNDNDNTNHDDDNHDKTTSTTPLLHVQEQHYETLRAKHEQLVLQDKTYDPNIHRPRVFCLRKLRAETEQDRLAAIRHVQER
jgi:hypothetical protein